MKKLFSILLALILVFCLMPASAMAEGEETAAQVSTLEELQAALNNGGTVKLVQDIEGDVTAEKEAILDLNGYVLKGELKIVSGGILTLKDSRPDSAHDSITYKDQIDGVTVYEVKGGVITGKPVKVLDGGKFIMEAGTLTGNTGIDVSHSTAVMTGGLIAGNYKGVGNGAEMDDGTRVTGGPISIEGSDASFTMKGGIITCNSSYDYQALMARYNRTIESCLQEGSAAGIFAFDGATFTMENGSITRNVHPCGGGVYVRNGGVFNLLNGEISENLAGGGGGVYMDYGTFNMSGGSIANNKAVGKWGCGGALSGWGTVTWKHIFNENEDYFDMPFRNIIKITGGSITGNSASQDGGAFCLPPVFYLELSGNASVTGNTAGGNGGGIYLGYLILSPDTNNMFETKNYNNVKIRYPGEINLKNCVISGNTAGKKGGGIYVPEVVNPISTNYSIDYHNSGEHYEGTCALPQFKLGLSGKVKITGNTSGTEDAKITDNIYLTGDAVITAEGSLTGTSVGVNTEKVPTETEPVVFTKGLSGKGSATNFTSDNPAYGVRLNSDKEAMLGFFTYDVTVAETQHGSISATAGDSSSLTGIAAGTTITLDVNPDHGYDLDTLTVKMDDIDVTVTPGANGKYTFTMPAADVTVTAAFKPQPVKYTVHYYYEGTTEKVFGDKVVTDAVFGESYDETPLDREGYKVVSGIDADGNIINNPSKLTVSFEEDVKDKEIIFYYAARTDLKYTVHYYYEGTTVKVFGDKVVTHAVFGESYDETPEAKVFCTVVSGIDTDGNTINNPEKLTVSFEKDVKDKEITFYYEKVPAVIESSPEANKLTYNASAQQLVTAGEAEGGTMQYAIGENSTTAPTSGWSGDIPEKTDAGTYYVWFKVVGDSDHNDSDPGCVTAGISEKKLIITAVDQSYTYNGKIQGEDNTVYDDSVTISKKVSVEGLEGEDSLTSIKIYGQGQDAREYPGEIVASSATIGEATKNYDITYVPGKLIIEPKDVTVKANDQSIREDLSISTEVENASLSDAVSGHILDSVTLTVQDGKIVPSNAVILDAEGNDATANYKITYQSGDLELIPLKYMIKFINEDGTELQSDEVVRGETPSYTGETPTKAPDDQYIYTFTGWTPEITAVTGDATYTAAYSKTDRIYNEPEWSWAEDNSEAKAIFTAADDDTYQVTVTASGIDKQRTTEPTCTEQGEFTYTATVTFNEKTYIGKTTEKIEPLGHDWSEEVEYEWNEDNTEVTASRVCKRDESHVESETVTPTAEVNTEPTCEEWGWTTYTATFKNEAFEADTFAEEDIEPLGHDWGDWKVTKEPEVGKEGETQRVCSRCGKTETETIEALPAPIVYTVTDGADGSWTQGSSEGFTLTVKRSKDDASCFSHYKETLIDGKAVAVTAKSGSTVVTISAEALEKLSAGTHTVTVKFDDGEAETKLTVNEAPAPEPTPPTGDSSRPGLWTGLLAVAVVCIGGLTVYSRKRRKTDK